MAGGGVGLDNPEEWKRVVNELLPGLPARFKTAVRQAMLQEGNFLRKQVIKAFTAQGSPAGAWDPLSPMTIAGRRFAGFRGTKILMQSGDMRKSITVIPAANGDVFVGVSRAAISSAKGGGNKSIVNIAIVQEFGAVIHVTVTRKMQRYLFKALAEGGPSTRSATTGRFEKGKSKSGPSKGTFRIGATITIRIPPRPFLGPVFEAYAKPEEVEHSLILRVAKLLDGDLGQP